MVHKPCSACWYVVQVLTWPIVLPHDHLGVIVRIAWLRQNSGCWEEGGEVYLLLGPGREQDEIVLL